MQNDNDMAGRIMAHAFNDELEKIAGSQGLKRQLRIAASRERLGKRLMGMPFESRPKADLDRWSALLGKGRKLNKRNAHRYLTGGRRDPRD